MTFEHPMILALLVLAPLVATVSFRFDNGRRWTNALFRAAIIVCLVLALSGVTLQFASRPRVAVLVVDLSPSTTPPTESEIHRLLARLQNSNGKDAVIRLVAFSNRARVIDDPSALTISSGLKSLRHDLSAPVASDDPASGGACLESALRLAGTAVPQNCDGAILIYSNGITTRGDAAAEAFRLAERGITVDTQTAPVVATDAPTVIIDSVECPPAARLGATVPLTVAFESRSSGRCRMIVKDGDKTVVDTTRDTIAGLNELSSLVPLSRPGLVAFSATCSVTGSDGVSGVDHGEAAVEVNSPTHVLLVQDQQSPGIAGALSSLLGAGATIEPITPGNFPKADLAGVDSIVLADLPAGELDGPSQARIRDAVIGGTGLLVCGASRSFGPGGYAESQLGPMLPVKMDQQAATIDPSTTLVVILDTSGSMGTSHRLDIGKAIAQLAISHLRPHDKIGLVEFYGGKRWAAPIQSAANSSVISRALNRLTAGGGTVLYPALEEARFALRSSNTQIKHVLIISDGGVEDAPFGPLIRRMADDGITISAAAVASDSGEKVMADLARWGGGHFYSVPDPLELPDILLKQSSTTISSPLVSRRSGVVAGSDPILSATDFQTPAHVDGYVRTKSAADADVLLESDSGDPLLVRWRYGGGFVAALTTQLGSTMTEGFDNDPAVATLLTALFRQVSETKNHGLTVKPLVRAAGLEVAVEQTQAGPPQYSGPLEMTVAESDGRVVRESLLEPTTPNHWDALFPGLPHGTYLIGAKPVGTGRSSVAAVALPTPRAVSRLTPDQGLLDRLRSFGSLAQLNAEKHSHSTRELFDLTTSLVLIAIVLFLVHIGMRRLAIKNGVGLQQGQL